jgi:murein DD-endopeptidase MepM/ murein hydrolase activator NlpD
MPNRKFKLIYLSHDLTKKVEFTLTHRKVRVALLALGVGFLATNVVAGFFMSYLINSRENGELKAQNETLRQHLNQVETRLSGVGEALGGLSQTDKMVRMMVDMPLVDEDVRQVGVGGSPLEAPAADIDPQLSNVLWTLDRVDREIEVQKASFEEIHQKLTEDQQRLDHTPTLRPLQGGFVSSGYGLRRDPFTKAMNRHEGLDISQERGTTVLAAAAGKIIYTGYYYSYGKFIVIEHGFGYQTAYGHLHAIDCREGQMVLKGQAIGQVGSTGRSTGCHLHYEVRVNGEPVNPSDYFFEELAELPDAVGK